VYPKFWVKLLLLSSGWKDHPSAKIGILCARAKEFGLNPIRCGLIDILRAVL
jgi:hypothetical protein